MVRPYKDADLSAIKNWHEQSGIDYSFPDLSSPLFHLIGVAESEDAPVAAATVKLIGEAYLWLNPAASTFAKTRALLQLHSALKRDAELEGFDQVMAWVTPEIDKNFGPHLQKLGWEKSVWQSYGKNL